MLGSPPSVATAARQEPRAHPVPSPQPARIAGKLEIAREAVFATQIEIAFARTAGGFSLIRVPVTLKATEQQK